MDEMPTEPGPAPEEPATAPASSVTSRRMLMLGAVGASTVIAVRPALAQATASVLTCQIPVPDPGNAGKYIDRNGNVVNPGPLGPLGALFGGPYPPPSRPFTGEEVRDAATLNASLLAWPNVMLRLNRPLPRRTWLRQSSFSRVAFRLDDPAPFVRLLAWRGGQRPG